MGSIPSSQTLSKCNQTAVYISYNSINDQIAPEELMLLERNRGRKSLLKMTMSGPALGIFTYINVFHNNILRYVELSLIQYEEM